MLRTNEQSAPAVTNDTGRRDTWHIAREFRRDGIIPLQQPFWSFFDARGVLIVALEIGSPTRQLPEVAKDAAADGLYRNRIMAQLNSLVLPHVSALAAEHLTVRSRGLIMQHRERGMPKSCQPRTETRVHQNTDNRLFITNLLVEGLKDFQEFRRNHGDQEPHASVQGFGAFFIAAPERQNKIVKCVVDSLRHAQNGYQMKRALAWGGDEAQTDASYISDRLLVRKFTGPR